MSDRKKEIWKNRALAVVLSVAMSMGLVLVGAPLWGVAVGSGIIGVGIGWMQLAWERDDTWQD
jgi:small-conductance mechanosensitive channel